VNYVEAGLDGTGDVRRILDDMTIHEAGGYLVNVERLILLRVEWPEGMTGRGTKSSNILPRDGCIVAKSSIDVLPKGKLGTAPIECPVMVSQAVYGRSQLLLNPSLPLDKDI